MDVIRRSPVYKSERDLAFGFLVRYLDESIEKNREFYTIIVSRGPGRFSPVPVQIGSRGSTDGFGVYLQSLNDANLRGVRATAYVHTHGADTPGIDDEVFSRGDRGDAATSRFYNLKGYLGTPERRFLELLPGQEVGTDMGYRIPGGTRATTGW
jgi:hypothetical protein